MIAVLVTPSSYRGASTLAAPLVHAWLAHRRRRGKEDALRFGERLGRASLPRPAGRLVWMHGASVGEGLSLLPLVARLRAACPAPRVLVTTGTVASAQLLRQRLPDGALHQFVPIDRPGAVRRFAHHWRPDLAVWVESELWPNLVLETAAQGVPMLLINARMSEGAAARWRKMPRLARPLLDSFARILAQTEADAGRFRALGARRVSVRGNLKNDAPPLPADADAVATLRHAIAGRRRWIAASTHDGEEAMVAEAHLSLRAAFPDLLAIVAPRHPERGDAVARLFRRRGLATARRSRNEAITHETAVYLADTLGELGLVYRLGGVAFVGGSLVPRGGHNPLEPARLDCAIVAGPWTGNFAEAHAALAGAGAVVQVADAATLVRSVGALLADEAARRRMGIAAATVADGLGGAADAALGLIDEHLGPSRSDARTGVLGA